MNKFYTKVVAYLHKKLFHCTLEKIKPIYKKVENFDSIRPCSTLGFCVYHLNDLGDSEKQEIEDYLISYYYARPEIDFFNICFDSILKIMLFVSALILIFSWIGYFFSIAPLFIFTLDILIIGFGYALRKEFLKMAFSSKLTVKNVIYDYNGERISYKKNIPVIKDKSILLTGFLLVLLTFSFYTVSIMGASLSNKSSSEIQSSKEQG